MSTNVAMPSAESVLIQLMGFQQSAALKAALELDLFTAIDEGAATASAIAARVNAAERGVRILSDTLVVLHLLTKTGDRYGLTPETAAFLSTRSRTYIGSAARFLLMPQMTANFERLTDAVRRGGCAGDTDTVAPDNAIWVEFARSMMPMMVPNAHAIAALVAGDEPLDVLDIAAGHGIFGITIAQQNRKAKITAVDWKAVLAVAEENARAMGVADRYRTIAGSAFDVEFGTGYGLALVTNFLHHFDRATNVKLLRKVHAAVKAGGRLAVLEFVPNPDRVSPPMPAMFSLTMLAGTHAGDAYTFQELRSQLEEAGFSDVSAHATPTPATVLLATRK